MKNIDAPGRTKLPSLRENHSSALECVAPTVLRIIIVAVPSPTGLGYTLTRLRRYDLVAIEVSTRVVVIESAPEARNNVAQPGRAGYTA